MDGVEEEEEYRGRTSGGRGEKGRGGLFGSLVLLGRLCNTASDPIRCWR